MTRKVSTDQDPTLSLRCSLYQAQQQPEERKSVDTSVKLLQISKENLESLCKGRLAKQENGLPIDKLQHFPLKKLVGKISLAYHLKQNETGKES